MITAMTPPGLTDLMPDRLAFGLAQNSTASSTDLDEQDWPLHDVPHENRGRHRRRRGRRPDEPPGRSRRR